MASQTSLDKRPLQTPQLDIDHLALADRDFQIKDIASPTYLLKLHCWSKGKNLNQNDDIHLWESNLPTYLFLEVHPFPQIIHFCQACYIPSQRAIVTPDQQVLFTITAESINQMLQVQPSPNETPLSIEGLLDLYTKLYLPTTAQIFQNFIIEECHTPTESPPYVATIFSEKGRQIITMLSYILGYASNEHVDEVVLAFLSIFCPGKPLATMYNYAQFIADRMHEQFIRLLNERVFKYYLVLFHMFLYYQSKKFPVNIQKLDTKGNQRSNIYWTPLIQMYSIVFTYKHFIDSFVHPVINMLTSSYLPRIS